MAHMQQRRSVTDRPIAHLHSLFLSQRLAVPAKKYTKIWVILFTDKATNRVEKRNFLGIGEHNIWKRDQFNGVRAINSSEKTDK